jgi:hypothetical protein
MEERANLMPMVRVAHLLPAAQCRVGSAFVQMELLHAPCIFFHPPYAAITHSPRTPAGGPAGPKIALHVAFPISFFREQEPTMQKHGPIKANERRRNIPSHTPMPGIDAAPIEGGARTGAQLPSTARVAKSTQGKQAKKRESGLRPADVLTNANRK